MEGGNRSSMGDALIHLMDRISGAWTTPLKSDLPHPQRFRYAFAGAFPWLWFNLNNEAWNNVFDSFPAEFVLDVVLALVQVLLGAWFAWLIAYQDRKCSPTRFFLEGLLLPGVATALLTGSRSLFGLLGGDS